MITIELQDKINKMKLKPLSSNKRYEFAKSHTKHRLYESLYETMAVYNKFDYYRMDGERLELFSIDYLKKHSFNDLKKQCKRNNFKGIAWKIKVYLFRLEMYLDMNIRKIKPFVSELFRW